MCSLSGIMSSILTIVAGMHLVGQLIFCDCIEKYFYNSGLDFKNGSRGFSISGDMTRTALLSLNKPIYIINVM